MTMLVLVARARQPIKNIESIKKINLDNTTLDFFCANKMAAGVSESILRAEYEFKTDFKNSKWRPSHSIIFIKLLDLNEDLQSATQKPLCNNFQVNLINF